MRIAILSICLMGLAACGPALTPQERFLRTVRSYEEGRLEIQAPDPDAAIDAEILLCPDWIPNTDERYRRPDWEGSLVEVRGLWILIELDGPREPTRFEGEIWFDLYRDLTYKGRAQVVDEFGPYVIGYVTTAVEGKVLEVGDRADTWL